MPERRSSETTTAVSGCSALVDDVKCVLSLSTPGGVWGGNGCCVGGFFAWEASPTRVHASLNNHCQNFIAPDTGSGSAPRLPPPPPPALQADLPQPLRNFAYRRRTPLHQEKTNKQKRGKDGGIRGVECGETTAHQPCERQRTK